MLKIFEHERTRNSINLMLWKLSAPIIAFCTRGVKRKVLNMKSPIRASSNLCFVLTICFLLHRRGKKVVHSISFSVHRCTPPRDFTLAYTNVGKKKTCLLDAKTENRRNELRLCILVYILHGGKLLLCRSGLCEAKEKPLTIHKMYIFRLCSVVLSTHNANLAKKFVASSSWTVDEISDYLHQELRFKTTKIIQWHKTKVKSKVNDWRSEN